MTADGLRRLAGLRIFFGHQSVGQDILTGVGDILRDTGSAVNMRVVQTSDAAELQPGVLAHTMVGKNGDPSSKIRAFGQHLDAGIGRHADIALFKYCYIDVDASTDVSRIFGEYKAELARLQRRYPDVRFVHVTMPLRKVQTGPKALLKRVLGKPAGGYLENVKRNEYNDLLRAEYAAGGSVFDLAEIEATPPDADATTFSYQGQTYRALNPDYTYDNGHLNETARRLVAERFLATLAKIQEEPQR